MTDRDRAFDDCVLKIRAHLDRMDYYHLLGLARNSAPSAVEEASVRVAARFDPRNHGDAPGEVKQAIRDIFLRLNEAASVLCDATARASYDEQLAGGNVRLSTGVRHPALPGTSADTIRSATARQFYLQAEQALVDGDFRQATLHLSMANLREPGNATIADMVVQIEERRREIQGLSDEEQEQVAASRSRTRRMALEREYGPGVWAKLLDNESITIEEVARIASGRDLPTSLLQRIADNPVWMADEQVRAALLRHPGLKMELAQKLVSMMPPLERRRISNLPGYPATVRKAVRTSLMPVPDR